MKRLLLAALFCTSIVYPPVVQAHYCHFHCSYYPDCSYCRTNEMVNKVILTTAVAGLSLYGTWYLFNKLPSRQYSSAQKTYMVLDEAVIRLLEDFNPVTDDISAFANSLYARSAYPLVSLFNVVDKAQVDAHGALQKIENALWWSKEEQFVRACNRLKEQLKKRITVYESLVVLMRANADWQRQYSLYLQQCQIDEMKRLTTQVALNGINQGLHCCHHYC